MSEEGNQEPTDQNLNKTALEIQQEYFESIGDADWELYKKDERKYLLQKIAVALCGSPTVEGDLYDNDEVKLQGYDTRDEETCMKVFDKIIEQAKHSHNGENIYISFLRIVCLIPKEAVPFYKVTPKDYWCDLHIKTGKDVNFLVFHVFSIRKCISWKPKVEACRIFIDHDARVYQNWRDYLENNKLPKCVMVVPANGRYRGRYQGVEAKENEMPLVKLKVVASPELGIGATVLKVTDNISTAANIGTLVATGATIALAPAAAPAVLTTAIGVGVVTGVYAITRSAVELADRSKHEQPIGLADSEARLAWINIVVSSVGITFASAQQLLRWAAEGGRNLKILMNALDFLRYSNLVTGFIGVANSLSDMIIKFAKYKETPTALELFQFTTSALFLGIGAMSNQTAETIVKDAQATKINEIRETLSSNNKKKIFDKVTAETRRVKGVIEGNTDVIKSLKIIENKDDFFGKLKNINKQVNKSKVRISLSSDGNVLVNNKHSISVSKVYSSGKEGQLKLFSQYGPAEVTTKNVPTRLQPTYATPYNCKGTQKDKSYEPLLNIRPEQLKIVASFLFYLTTNEKDYLADVISEVIRSLHDEFLLYCAELVEYLTPGIELIEESFPDWKKGVLYFIQNYWKTLAEGYDSDGEFISEIKSCIINGRVSDKMMLQMYKQIMNYFSTLKKQRKVNDNVANDYNNFKPHKDNNDTNAKQVNLEAGDIKIGKHTILIKPETIEKIDKYLENCTEEQADSFIQTCFTLISMCSNEEIFKLTMVNPDEDILMTVAGYLYEKLDELESYHVEKVKLIKWGQCKLLRKYELCLVCTGVCFSSSTQ